MKLRIPEDLSDEQIGEYQRIFKDTYGEEISFEEARELGLSLIRLVALIIGNH